MNDNTSTPEVDEFTRQRALDRYRVVDSLPESAYDDIVRVAAAVCDTPVALVSLIDRDRQWFKARIGIDDSQTPRDVAVCDTAIRTPNEFMEVKDLSQDARFADFPSVAGDFSARFYAGAPLLTPEGAPIGTVCVVDHEPRQLTAAQRSALEALGRLTMALLEGRSRERDSEIESILQPAPVSVATAEVEPPPQAGYSVAIIELQDYAGLVSRMGERGVEKALQQLEHDLEQCLHGPRGDVLNRVTGSGEFIAVLQGDDTVATLQRLEEVANAQGGKGLSLLLASAAAADSREPTQQVFMRADEALSLRKDLAQAP
jgi:hypothetical protein